MTDFKLVIGNKTYSSWSLRSWLLMREADIPFTEELIQLDTPEFKNEVRAFGPGGRVPLLIHGDIAVWDTLAIAEYLAELFPEKDLWPTDATARAYARSCVAEMHSGFFDLRGALSMNLRRPRGSLEVSEATQADIDRVCEIWTTCRERFGGDGPMLFGKFSIADAFYAPVVSRFDTYGIPVPEAAAEYMASVLALDGMREWYADAAKETRILESEEVD